MTSLSWTWALIRSKSTMYTVIQFTGVLKFGRLQLWSYFNLIWKDWDLYTGAGWSDIYVSICQACLSFELLVGVLLDHNLLNSIYQQKGDKINKKLRQHWVTIWRTQKIRQNATFLLKNAKLNQRPKISWNRNG